jgi:hypothetical protein
MNRKLPWMATVFLLAVATLGAAEKRIHLLPKLQPGQTIVYLIRVKGEKDVKTESKVAAPMAPNDAQIDAHGLLRIEILDVQPGNKATIHARGQFLSMDSGVSVKNPDGKPIEFTISSDGAVNDARNLDALLPGQQQAWQQWVARFAMAWALPPDGVKFGEKWKSGESERAGSPIAGLQWARESAYVKNEPCQPRQLSIDGEVAASTSPPDNCAVLLTTSILKQKSSTKDATPEDFKLHDLRTMGSAKGTSEIISYISLKTGLVVRATEETTQMMDVMVAKSDGSNRVRYHVDARSRAEVLLVTETLLNQP